MVETAVASNINTSGLGIGELPLLLLSATLEDPQSGFLVFDRQLRLLHATPQMPRLLALQTAESMGDPNVLELLSRSALDQASAENARAHILAFASGETSEPLVLRDREQARYMRMKLRMIGDHGIASFEAISPRERAQIQAPDSGAHDPLTGLASRVHFEHMVGEALRQSPEEPVVVLILDLNRFKAVNDTLGHGVGDTVLKLAADRLRSVVRSSDSIARLGGDEFGILLRSSRGSGEPARIATRILDLVQRTYSIGGHQVNVGTSIGIARSPEDGTECHALLRCADLALHHSKMSGRASFHFFEDHMERRAQARRTSELELRRALPARQLEVFYQPQVNTMANRLIGFEALVRWRHPERGLIPPGDFMPIAEQIGLIVPIGEWVLQTACREAVNWPDHVVIAVNVSPLQFDLGDFGECVRQALDQTGLPGERLEIEITEGMLLRDDEVVSKTIRDLRALKVRIAMDDFGTGYASLSQLARFPFDKIKIDRSLTGFDGYSVRQRAIVRAIVALGQSLGVETMAEGVEDAEQLERLRSDGCTSVQGYYFGRPLPANQLDAILERFRLAG